MIGRVQVFSRPLLVCLQSRVPAQVVLGLPSPCSGPSALGFRQLAGRSSGKPPWGEKKDEEAVADESKAEEASTSTSSSSAAAGGSSGSASPSSEASKAQAAIAAAASSPDKAQPGAGGTSAPALFVLPLYRKPAFPGFYQIVQVSEQEVLDFLFALRKAGQGDYLGGFMTKELPTKVAESELEQPSSGGSSSVTSQSLRRDAGRINSVAEIEEVGTVLQVINLTQYPNISGGQVVVMPHKRIRRTKTVSAPSPNVALAAVAVEYLDEPEVDVNDDKVKKLHKEIMAKMQDLLKTSLVYKEQFEQVIRFYDLDHPLKLADLIAGMSLAQREELQAVLTENNLGNRLEKVLAIVEKDLEFARLQSRMKSQAEEKVTKEQRRIMLMAQMNNIMKELGIDKDEKQTLITQFRDAVAEMTLPAEAEKVFEAELTKLATLEPSSSEYNVCRTYLEWITSVPWGIHTEENKDIKRAEGILDEDHYGLEDVKERILEHIAVSFLKGSIQGKIMCLAGPPGVGKTSIGKSIARALDRKFYRFSVGGMHDVSELRGHRRTYVGAMPGKLIQCLKMVGSSNPVILIDEIDKLGRDYRGDPSSAFLEILDPEQNNSFRDHYLDVPVDLSRCLFVCTANVIDHIPGPLLDRMEVIRIAGYVHEEKVAIANQYLIPQTEEMSGIGKESLVMKDEALQKIIGDYAREAGVRQLRKLLEKINRKVALKVVRKKDVEREKTEINLENLASFIGQPPFQSDRLYGSVAPPGVVMGLAWTQMGGATLYIEAIGHGKAGINTAIEFVADKGEDDEDDQAKEEPKRKGGGGGSMKITGQLGEVMSESAAVCLTYSRLFMRELNPDFTYLEDTAIHLNVPEGAVPKDGPSAGVTMATALMSMALHTSIKPDLAMTGELTLSGKVLKVGGIKEKVIAARREGIKTLLLPRQNEADYTELKDYLKTGIDRPTLQPTPRRPHNDGDMASLPTSATTTTMCTGLPSTAASCRSCPSLRAACRS